MKVKENNIKNKIMSGLFWKFSERILAQGVSFLVSVVLARLLTPNDYGIVAIILIFISLADVFVTSGFSTALVQNKNATVKDFSTNFYCSLLVSIVIYLVLFFLAPVISEFYNSSELCLVLRVFSLRIPLSAFSAIQHAYVERNMLFKKYFFSTLFGTLVSGIVGVILAYFGFGVWALVAQYLTNTFIDIVVLLITVPWKPTFEFSYNSAVKMMKYGWKIFAADFAGTFFEQLRSIIIGKVYTSADLAFYNKGNQLPTLITSNVGSSIMSVLFPAMSNFNDDLEKVKYITRRAVKIMAYVMFPLLFGLSAVSKPLVEFLFTDRWLMAVPYVRILSIAYAISLIGSISLQAIKAVGRSDILLKLEIIKKPVYLLLLIVGMKISVIAVAFTMGIYNIYGTIVNASALKSIIKYDYKSQLEDLLPTLFLSGIMFIIVLNLQNIPLSPILVILIQLIIGVGVYIVLSIVTKQESFGEIIDILKKEVKKRNEK